jgi:hypothetical protein
MPMMNSSRLSRSAGMSRKGLTEKPVFDPRYSHGAVLGPCCNDVRPRGKGTGYDTLLVAREPQAHGLVGSLGVERLLRVPCACCEVCARTCDPAHVGRKFAGGDAPLVSNEGGENALHVWEVRSMLEGQSLIVSAILVVVLHARIAVRKCKVEHCAVAPLKLCKVWVAVSQEPPAPQSLVAAPAQDCAAVWCPTAAVDKLHVPLCDEAIQQSKSRMRAGSVAVKPHCLVLVDDWVLLHPACVLIYNCPGFRCLRLRLFPYLLVRVCDCIQTA